MALKNRTKLMFAQELQRMLKSQTLDEIRVVTLCQRCDTIPQTFYYHFHDKYALVAWNILYDFSVIYGDQVPEYSVDRLTAGLTRIANHQTFYRKVYTDHSQNAINRCIQQFNVQNASKAVRASLGDQPFTQDMHTAIAYHTYGMTGLLTEWLTSDSPLTQEQLAHFLYTHTPDFLRHAYQQYAFKNSAIFSISL